MDNQTTLKRSQPNQKIQTESVEDQSFWQGIVDCLMSLVSHIKRHKLEGR